MSTLPLNTHRGRLHLFEAQMCRVVDLHDAEAVVGGAERAPGRLLVGEVADALPAAGRPADQVHRRAGVGVGRGAGAVQHLKR